MSDTIEVRVSAGASGFAEDKDEARELRKNSIMPALLANRKVVLNFGGVTSSTQSFVHALIGEPIQKIGEAVLDRLEFRSCGPQIKSLVELVVDYSLSGFGPSSKVQVVTGSSKKTSEKTAARSTPRQRRTRRNPREGQ